MTIPDFERGTTVTIKSTVTDDEGTVVQPDNKEVNIEIKDLDTGSVMVSRTTMTDISDTQYKYEWQTTEGMTVGEYEVEVDADISNNTIVNRDRIRLDDIVCNE